MGTPFVPKEFIIPEVLETGEFRLRTLTVHDVVKDYDAVIIDPTYKRGYDAEVYLWARESELAGGLETRLHDAVKSWIAKEWPFKTVAFPGRDIVWDAWRAIPDTER